MDLMALSATLTLDSKDYEQGIKKAQTSGNQLAANLEKSFGRIKTALKAAFTVAAVKKSVDGIMNLANTTAQAADRIDKQSQALGISRKAFQQWDYILAQSGASIDSLGVSMKTLNTAILGGSDSAVEAFDQLGLKLSDLQGLSQEDAFGKVVDAFQRMPQDARKSALAVQLLGKQGQSLMPLLNTSADSMAELRANTERLGFTMSDSMVDAGVKFGDKLDDLKRTAGGLKNTLGYALMEPLTGIFEAVTNFFAQEDTQTAVKQFAVDLNSLGNLVLTGVQGFFQFLTDHKEDISNVIKGVSSFASDLFDISDVKLPSVDELAEMVKSWWNGSNGSGGAKERIAQFLDWYLNVPGEPQGDPVDVISKWWSGGEGGKGMKEKIQDAVKWVLNLPSTPPNESGAQLHEMISEWWANQKEKAQSLLYWALGNPDAPPDSEEARSGLVDAVSAWWEKAKPILEALLDFTLGVLGMPPLSETTERIREFWDDVKKITRHFLSLVFSLLPPSVQEAIEAIKSWWDSVVKSVKLTLSAKVIGIGASSAGLTTLENGSYTNKSGAVWGSAAGSGLDFLDKYTPEAAGIDYVPSNGMHAILHEGEAVLNKRNATAWRSGGQPQISAAALASAVSSALEGMAVVMDKEQVGRLTAQTVSRELERKARAGRFAFA